MKAKQRSKSVISFGTSFISTAPTERIDWVNPIYFQAELKGRLLNRVNAPKRDQNPGRWENLIKKQVDLKGRTSSQRLRENNQSIRVLEPQQFGSHKIRFSKKVYPTVCIDLTNCSGLLHLRQTNKQRKLGSFTKKVMVEGDNKYHYRNVTSKQNSLCTSDSYKFSTGQKINNEIKEKRISFKFVIPGKITKSQIDQLPGSSLQTSPKRIRQKVVIKNTDNLEVGSLTPKNQSPQRSQNFNVANICRNQKFGDIGSSSKVKRVTVNLSQYQIDSQNISRILNQSTEELYEAKREGRKMNHAAMRRILQSRCIS